jgi:undecaprenyl pyrophosphate phosphatase UppP
VITAAFLYEAVKEDAGFKFFLDINYLIGILVAFVTGYIALFILSLLIKKSRLDIFGYYCLAVSAVILLFNL